MSYVFFLVSYVAEENLFEYRFDFDLESISHAQYGQLYL